MLENVVRSPERVNSAATVRSLLLDIFDLRSPLGANKSVVVAFPRYQHTNQNKLKLNWVRLFYNDDVGSENPWVGGRL